MGPEERRKGKDKLTLKDCAPVEAVRDKHSIRSIVQEQI